MNMPKINLYATIMPYDFSMALSFHRSDTVGDIHFFVEETFKKLRIRYKVGRIELKSNKAWLLPQYAIGEFLCSKEEIVVYSIEYGIRQREIDDKSVELEDIDELFIGKKMKRKREEDDEDGKKSFMKSKALSLNAKKIKHNLKLKEKANSDQDDDSEHSDGNDEEDKEEEKSNDNDNEAKSKSSEKKVEEEEEEENNAQPEEEDDESGSDKEDDIALPTKKK